VNRYAERRGRTSRFWKFLHELPVLLFAVGLTKLTEGANRLGEIGQRSFEDHVHCDRHDGGLRRLRYRSVVVFWSQST